MYFWHLPHKQTNINIYKNFMIIILIYIQINNSEYDMQKVNDIRHETMQIMPAVMILKVIHFVFLHEWFIIKDKT